MAVEAKKPKKQVNKYSAYEVSGESATRVKKSCPRCGPGIFMADHKSRTSCGKCGYTEFSNEKPAEQPKKEEQKPAEESPKKEKKSAEKPEEKQEEKSVAPKEQSKEETKTETSTDSEASK